MAASLTLGMRFRLKKDWGGPGAHKGDIVEVRHVGPLAGNGGEAVPLDALWIGPPSSKPPFPGRNVWWLGQSGSGAEAKLWVEYFEEEVAAGVRVAERSESAWA